MESILAIVILLLNLYSFILIGRILLSWLPNIDRSHPAVRFLYEITEPVLRPIREMLPPVQGMDFSPLVLMIGISLLTGVLARLA